jgi:transcriptional regulator with XRE-family HTH domain
MSRSTLTGTRIRALRTARGMRQSDLARLAGISASYLNLIEHNRRRVSPELLAHFAVALGVAPGALTEGAGSAVFDGLRGAAARADLGKITAELDRMDEFVDRFPGWAGVLAATNARIEALERTVEQLSDRMTHDPYLSAALHEIVSVVTSVQSTAAILADTDDIAPEWRQKFHQNILKDSVRLADGAEALVGYLDSSGTDETGLAAPQEEVEAWLAAQAYHFDALERPDAPEPATLVQGQMDLASDAAQVLAVQWLRRYRTDALALPLEPFLAAVRAIGIQPDQLAARFEVGLGQVFRRLASLPVLPDLAPVGLVLCDGSGTLTFRKPLDGFALPRFGGACPLWPLYEALRKPYYPIRVAVLTAARAPRRFTAFAYGTMRGTPSFTDLAVPEAAMLLTPSDPNEPLDQATHSLGASCRICPRGECPARREPSILAAAV